VNLLTIKDFINCVLVMIMVIKEGHEFPVLTGPDSLKVKQEHTQHISL